MRIFFLALAALLFAASEPASAQTASWRVSEASGDVRIVEGGRSRPATRGALLAGGSVVATAQRARAVLVRGRDYVIVSPASRVRVPTAAQGGSRGLVQIMAEAGTAMFRIEHRARPHFAVQTPYLAAVVKGTVFTVTVGEAGASVQVTEGAVEVSTADGGAAELVRPGMIATVSAADLQQLNIQGETNRSIRSNGAPAAGVVTVPPAETGNYQGPADSPAIVTASVTEEPVALNEVTGGLVEGNAGVDLALANVRDTARPDVGGAGEAGNGAGGTGSANGDATATPGNDGGAGNSGNGGGNDNSGPGNNNGGGGAAGVPGDDGNNGHGNDDDGDDAGNPGNGGGNDNSGPGNNNGGGGAAGVPGDDGNNGHGNDDDGDDAGNPGNGGGNDNSGPGNNNGGGNDNSGPGNNNGGGNDNSGPGNNNGGGNDADDDNSGPGNGGGRGGGNGGGPDGGNGEDD